VPGVYLAPTGAGATPLLPSIPLTPSPWPRGVTLFLITLPLPHSHTPSLSPPPHSPCVLPFSSLPVPVRLRVVTLSLGFHTHHNPSPSPFPPTHSLCAMPFSSVPVRPRVWLAHELWASTLTTLPHPTPSAHFPSPQLLFLCARGCGPLTSSGLSQGKEKSSSQALFSNPVLKPRTIKAFTLSSQAPSFHPPPCKALSDLPSTGTAKCSSTGVPKACPWWFAVPTLVHQWLCLLLAFLNSARNIPPDPLAPFVLRVIHGVEAQWSPPMHRGATGGP